MNESDAAIVYLELDPDNLPPLSEAQKVEVAVLAAKADDDIDHSEIPSLADGFWQSAQRGRFLGR
jgi:hypothetical protein